jgi:hypothetical protein
MESSFYPQPKKHKTTINKIKPIIRKPQTSPLGAWGKKVNKGKAARRIPDTGIKTIRVTIHSKHAK